MAQRGSVDGHLVLASPGDGPKLRWARHGYRQDGYLGTDLPAGTRRLRSSYPGPRLGECRRPNGDCLDAADKGADDKEIEGDKDLDKKEGDDDEALARGKKIIEEQEKVESFNLGVAGYMLKPVDYLQFVEVVRAIDLYWTLSELPG